MITNIALRKCPGAITTLNGSDIVNLLLRNSRQSHAFLENPSLFASVTGIPQILRKLHSTMNTRSTCLCVYKHLQGHWEIMYTCYLLQRTVLRLTIIVSLSGVRWPTVTYSACFIFEWEHKHNFSYRNREREPCSRSIFVYFYFQSRCI